MPTEPMIDTHPDPIRDWIYRRPIFHVTEGRRLV